MTFSKGPSDDASPPGSQSRSSHPDQPVNDLYDRLRTKLSRQDFDTWFASTPCRFETDFGRPSEPTFILAWRGLCQGWSFRTGCSESRFFGSNGLDMRNLDRFFGQTRVPWFEFHILLSIT